MRWFRSFLAGGTALHVDCEVRARVWLWCACLAWVAFVHCQCACLMFPTVAVMLSSMLVLSVYAR